MTSVSGKPSRVPAALWAAAILAALVLRFYALDLPFVERFNNISRQAMCASVARNLADRGFRIFYPEIDTGAGPYLYNVEMPVYAIPMALLYRLAGGAEEWAARLVSVLMSLLFLWALTARTRVWFGDRVAWAALLFAGLSPMSVALSRSIQPDITMMGLGMAAIHFGLLYLESGRMRWWALSAGLLFLAALTRVFALQWLALLLILWAARDGLKKTAVNPRVWIFLAVVLLSLGWYAVMWWQGRNEKLVFEPYDYARGDMRFLPYWKLFDWTHLKLDLKALTLHLLTPAGVLLAAAGWGREGREAAWPLRVWTLLTLGYLAAMWPTAMSHPYYLLPLLPLAAIWVGLGADRCAEFLRQNISGSRSPRRAAALWTAAAVLFAAVAAAPLAYYYRLLYVLPEDRKAIVRIGEAVNEVVPADDLVIAVWEGSPIQLYYAGRRGWPMDLKSADDEALIAKLEQYRSLGARWFVTPQTDRLKQRPAFAQYLSRRYTVRLDAEREFIADLRTPKS